MQAPASSLINPWLRKLTENNNDALQHDNTNSFARWNISLGIDTSQWSCPPIKQIEVQRTIPDSELYI